jgi:GMP synthase-like glutamine amidotransferase
MRILAVVHGDDVRPELYGDWAREAGHEVAEWRIADGGEPPAGDAVIVFGGAQNVGEEDRYPWLEDEYELLRGWVADGTPFLGVCLGAQTLAHAAGARVARTETPQVGIHEVTLTEEGTRDPVLGALPARFEALFSNAFAFEVPDGGVELARSPGRAQAFRLGERAWGVQFHPEVRREQVLHWWDRRSWLPKPYEELERDLDEKLGAVQRDGRALCAAFLDAASR